MKSNIIIGAALAASLTLAGCGSSNPGPTAPVNVVVPQVVAQVAIPNVAAGTNFSFDISLINRVGGNAFMAFTDRNNKSVDEVALSNNAVTLITGGNVGAFAGLVPPAPGSIGGTSNGISGPDGLNVISATLMIAGDVGSAKVINTSSKTTEYNITSAAMNAAYAVSGYPAPGITTNMKTRADEGCAGPASPTGRYFWISSPEAIPPFATIIDTGLIPTTIPSPVPAVSPAVVLTITFTDIAAAPSAGLENCQFDGTNWYVNNDGTTANPRGEFVMIPHAVILAATGFGTAGATVNYTTLIAAPAGTLVAGAGVGYGTSMGTCDPTGLALNTTGATLDAIGIPTAAPTSTDIAVGCRPGVVGDPLILQIMTRTNGAIKKTITGGGGGDELAYDLRTNRYYNAASRWSAAGTSVGPAGCSATALCSPSLTVIDATSLAVVERIPTGNNSHSVAVDPVTGFAYVPFSSATSPAGCGTCTANGFISGGVLVIQP